MSAAKLEPRIALLRGVNLGGRRMEMLRLREVLAGHGHADVRTYLQTGNVLFRSGATPDELETVLERQLRDGFGLQIDVVVRTLDELERIVALDPLGTVASDPSRYLVTFLRRPLARSVVESLEALDLRPELLAIHGRELYSWHPNGQARSELGKHLYGRALGTAATARNWNSVVRLLEIARELA
jgi:uncharacterized protein (DUF1697 family)